MGKNKRRGGAFAQTASLGNTGNHQCTHILYCKHTIIDAFIGTLGLGSNVCGEVAHPDPLLHMWNSNSFGKKGGRKKYKKIHRRIIVPLRRRRPSSTAAASAFSLPRRFPSLLLWSVGEYNCPRNGSILPTSQPTACPLHHTGTP